MNTTLFEHVMPQFLCDLLLIQKHKSAKQPRTFLKYTFMPVSLWSFTYTRILIRFFVIFYLYKNINLQNYRRRFGNTLLCHSSLWSLTFTETQICKTPQDILEIHCCATALCDLLLYRNTNLRNSTEHFGNTLLCHSSLWSFTES